VCRELKISDWTKKKAAKVSPREARKILPVVNKEKMKIDLQEFCKGLEVELEHGITFKDANVTNNHRSSPGDRAGALQGILGLLQAS